MEHTSPDYWDCECDVHYIHPLDDEECPVCGAVREDSPDSMLDEISIPENHFREKGVNHEQ